METRHKITGYSGKKEGTSIALGYFDGVHIGHQAVIRAAVEAAGENLTPAVFTFRHEEGESPKGKSLLALRQKHALLERMGVEDCFEPAFSEFSSMSPEAFVQDMLAGSFAAKKVFCGGNFYFGKNKAGDVALLRTLCEAAGIEVTIVPTTLWEGEPVSSSRIRKALEAGDIDAVNAMLGRPYEISFPVESGRHLGRMLGFPTINQKFPDWMQAPAHGVYITQVVLGAKRWPAATGYGTRPTVGGKHATCETFIPGFSGDLYGTRVRVKFFKRIAESETFETPEKLAEAVQGWAGQATAYFAEEQPVNR